MADKKESSKKTTTTIEYNEEKIQIKKIKKQPTKKNI